MVKKLIVLLLLLLPLGAQAQTCTITGHVDQPDLTAGKVPAPGVTVSVLKVVKAGLLMRNATRSVPTDDAGNFSIVLPAESTAWVSIPSIGFGGQMGEPLAIPAAGQCPAVISTLPRGPGQAQSLTPVIVVQSTGGGGAVGSVFGRTGAVVAGVNDYTWAQVNKATSSLADIATRSASDLNSGTLPLARLAGITDAQIATGAAIQFAKLAGVAAASHTHAESDVTGLVSDLAGKQPLDSDLTAIAAIAPTNDDVIQRKGGAWINRSIAQLKSDFALAKADVGLGAVENTALSTWAGSTNITTLGTIATGTWGGSVIGSTKGGAGSINGILKANGSGVVAGVTIGSGLSFDGTTLIATASGGSVTDFSAGDLSPLFTTSEATTTTTPALTFSLNNAGANTYFGNATGSSAAPSYTAAGALTKTDDTNVTLTLGGNPATSLLRAVSITVGWAGTLAAARLNANVVQGVTNDTNVTGSISAQVLTLGWTGALSKARQHSATVYNDQANTFGAFVQTFQAGANHVLVDPTDTSKKATFDLSANTTATTRAVTIANGASTTVIADAGAANQFLTAISVGGVISKAQPGFSNLSGAATLAQLPFGTANQILGTNAGVTAQEHKTLAVGTTGSDFNIAHAANAITFHLPTASASNRGALSAADWSTFNGKGSVSTVSVASANGFAGSVATATSTPAITITTTITGVLKGNGTAISAATPGTDYTTPSSTETPTNKTFVTTTAGGTNTITMPFKYWFPAAGCNGSTAGTFWDLPSSTPAVATCVGTNVVKGVLAYADTSGGFSAQNHVLLPADFTGAIDARIIWTTTATTGNAKWSLSTICTDVAATATDDPTYNTASTVTTAAPGTASRVQTSSISSVTITGCAAGNLLHFKLFRDGNDASDTITATANLIGVELTIKGAK